MADRSYLKDGVRILELAHRAHRESESQPPTERRNLLDCVLSNRTWKDGRLAAEYRQSFDLIAAAAQVDRQLSGNGGPESGNS